MSDNRLTIKRDEINAILTQSELEELKPPKAASANFSWPENGMCKYDAFVFVTNSDYPDTSLRLTLFRYFIFFFFLLFRHKNWCSDNDFTLPQDQLFSYTKSANFNSLCIEKQSSPEWKWDNCPEGPCQPWNGIYIETCISFFLIFLCSVCKQSTIRQIVCFHELEVHSEKKTSSVVLVCSRGPCTLLVEVDKKDVFYSKNTSFNKHKVQRPEISPHIWLLCELCNILKLTDFCQNVCYVKWHRQFWK